MKTDMSPQPPVPELWQALDEAAREFVPPSFPHDRIVQRSKVIKRRRSLAAAALGAALLVPVGIGVVALSEPDASHTVTSPRPIPSHSPSPHRTANRDSEVRIVRPGERIQAGLGVWYLLKPTEMCDGQAGDEKPICVGVLDTYRTGAVPMTQNWTPLAKGVVHVLAYNGRIPATRITMTEDGLTTVLPIVRLAGRPAYVSTYAVSSPEDPVERTRSPRKAGGGPVFRVYDADGEELARMDGW
ncbi:hypothetical protein ACWDR3_11530 [Streptomyces sp. NPDC001002]